MLECLIKTLTSFLEWASSLFAPSANIPVRFPPVLPCHCNKHADLRSNQAYGNPKLPGTCIFRVIWYHFVVPPGWGMLDCPTRCPTSSGTLQGLLLAKVLWSFQHIPTPPTKKTAKGKWDAASSPMSLFKLFITKSKVQRLEWHNGKIDIHTPLCQVMQYPRRFPTDCCL